MSSNYTPWERVQISRSAERPTSLDYISTIFERYMSLHGDRYFGDDKAIVGGLASIGGRPVKFHRPIILFVDTPGAFCGLEAEEGGVGEAIARNLFEMSNIKVPILSIMIGEGGSGGALAMAVGNEVWSMENSTYSVLSPEGFAAILWKDGNRASEAAKVMKITAEDLKELGVIEQVIEEPEPVSIDNILEISEQMKEMILGFIEKYDKMTPEELVEQRYQRFRKF